MVQMIGIAAIAFISTLGLCFAAEKWKSSQSTHHEWVATNTNSNQAQKTSSVDKKQNNDQSRHETETSGLDLWNKHRKWATKVQEPSNPLSPEEWEATSKRAFSSLAHGQNKGTQHEAYGATSQAENQKKCIRSSNQATVNQ